MSDETRPHRCGDELIAAGIQISPPWRVTGDLLAEGERVTPEVAARLAAAVGTSAQFWLNLQDCYDNYLEQTGAAR